MRIEPPKVIQHDTFTNTENEQVNRLVLDVNGHNVQILQYDESLNVLVYVDQHAKIIHIDNAAQFIASYTSEG